MPVITDTLPGIVAHLPQGGRRVCLPVYLCAVTHLVGMGFVAWHCRPELNGKVAPALV